MKSNSCRSVKAAELLRALAALLSFFVFVRDEACPILLGGCGPVRFCCFGQ